MTCKRSVWSRCMNCAYFFLVLTPMLLVSSDNTQRNEKVDFENQNGDSNNVRTDNDINLFIDDKNQVSNPSNNHEKNPIKEQSDKIKFNVSASSNTNASIVLDDDELSGDEYDYEYNISDSHSTFNWGELIPTIVVYGATMVIGIAGNSLIIFTICRYRRMKSTTNVFLASLASADLLLIIICIPVKVAKLFSYSWSMGFFLCKGVHYLQNVSAICSVLTLTAMSIERYYAIVHPMKAKYICTISQARKIILGIWVASFLLAVPNLISQEHVQVGMKYKAYYCVHSMEKPSLWRFHEVYMLLLILVIPTCIMVVAYGSISWEIWHVMQKRYDMTSGQALNPAGGRGGVESFPLRYSKRLNRGMSSNAGSFRESIKKANSIRNEEENNTVKQVTGAPPFGSRLPGLQNHLLQQQKTHQVIKMLVAVVVLFVVCWAPLLILNVLYAYDILEKYSSEGDKNVQSAFTVMAYSNSCINPLVYGFMSKNFRESFYKALCRCCYKGGRFPKRHLSVSQTRSTSVRYADSSLGRSVSISTTPY